MAGVTSVSDSEEPKGRSVQGDPESEGEEEGTEYEIEQVLDAKRGYFPDGRMGYFVKWKGYGSEENSWVDEQDALNAGDLVKEYWAKNPKKKAAARKSLDKKSPKKPRKSVPAEDSSDAGHASAKKRGRKSSTKTFVESDEMDVDEGEPRVPKKARRASIKTTKVKTATPEPEERTIGNMNSYLHMKQWDGLVKSVDTVERDGDNNLVVYFTLQSGEPVMADSTTCNERFPKKMLSFYESNLRWRSVEDKESP
ncbi:hypothetical protein M413DRAFT_442783 [Hebeloma cylindrosporum]|uniref:Chromo domain-containing protein n=1 Tax=Hebeloma cylindrosporum TaxID=76867 RepID=A0A0C3CM14_HEBCY|nr:hypothetical protein M413DRAFT_442783 [Hebeloma cylindrosporum h7]